MIDLAKIERQAPQLVSLAKDAGVSLAKAGLQGHVANVVLVLDVSGSTSGLYSRGVIQAVADKAFVMALHFDDDGEVPLCYFNHQASDAGVLNLSNYTGYIDRTARADGGTNYSSAIAWAREAAGYGKQKRGLFRKKSSPEGPVQTPTYVLFVTDGEPTDSRTAIQQELADASREPIFWQFIGVGSNNFPFLEQLDTMGGRLIDNAGFFAVANPQTFSNDQMYQMLLSEYPSWITQAKAHGLIV